MEVTLLQLVSNHPPRDEKERVDRATMIDFARSLAAPFSRTQWPAHFTGSAIVVSPDGARVLLVLHAKLKRWLQPGGHADPSDAGSMEQTALREAREESGLEVRLHRSAPRPLDLDVHTIPARKDEPEHAHLDVRYLVVASDPEKLAPDPNEAHGAQWLGWDDALALADEAPLRRLLEKARAACNTPEHP